MVHLAPTDGEVKGRRMSFCSPGNGQGNAEEMVTIQYVPGEEDLGSSGRQLASLLKPLNRRDRRWI